MSMMRSFGASLLAARVYYREDQGLHTQQNRNYVSNLKSDIGKNAIEKAECLRPVLRSNSYNS